MNAPEERVAQPPRRHTHPDGKRCVQTNLGRWMRRGDGINDAAECPDPKDAP